MTEQQGPPPRVISGRYTLVQQLGQGGMGTVWRAADQVIGRHVAIKELRLPDELPPQERAVFADRVLREARSAGRLNAPGVVTVYDVVSEGGSDFIVMELVEAPTLESVVAARGPLDSASAARIADQVLAALEAAHAAGVVHRDVKPANIMLLPDGRVKLADFGIAQAADDPRLTSTGSLIGSPGYMAPERLERNVTDPACDLWSLGATLFYAVEGRGAFERDTTASTIYAVMSEVPYLTRAGGPLAAAITGMLVANPAGRLTAPQVRALLQRVGSTEGGTVAFNQPGAQAPATRLSGAPTVLQGQSTAPARLPRPQTILIGLGVGLVVALALFGVGWWVGAAVSGSGDAEVLTYGGGGDFDVFEISEATCSSGALQPGRSFPSSTAIGCEEPHDFEVYASDQGSFSSTEVGYPEQEALADYGRGICQVVFDSNAVSGSKDELVVTVVVPTRQSWEDTENGDRTVYCALSREDGAQITGSRLTGS